MPPICLWPTKLALLLGACREWCMGLSAAAAEDPGVFPELQALVLAGFLEHDPLHEPSSRGPRKVLQSVQYHIKQVEKRFNDDDGDGMATLDAKACCAAVGVNVPRGIPRFSFLPVGT